ncbi:MAG: efflux RND transporter periplasmic adaptor subunit [Opitutaceae bacterium]|nr:efflux RND transporter periplasmic adaptor subunit [Opitutaceae bacterium]
MKFLLLLLLLPLAACRRPAESAVSVEAAPLAVRTGVVTSTVMRQTQAVAGTVRPAERAVVAARIMGTVTLADLAVGRQVRAGATLVTLQADELTARVAQARALVNQADRDYDREQALAAKGASTTEAVRAASDRRDQARAALQEAEAALTYTRISAPFDGVLTGDFVNPGDLASPGQPLFELEGIDHMRVEAQIPEALGLPVMGREIAVQCAAGAITGQLVEFSPAADAGSRSRLAKIELPAGAGVHSGEFVRVLWPAGSEVTLTVPASAVVVFGQMERVFTVNHDRAGLRLVKTGGRHGDAVVVLAGLDAGEAVVLHPPAGLRDGQLLKVIP